MSTELVTVGGEGWQLQTLPANEADDKVLSQLYRSTNGCFRKVRQSL